LWFQSVTDIDFANLRRHQFWGSHIDFRDPNPQRHLWICGFSLWNLRPPWFAVAIFGITWKCRCLKWGALFNHQNSDFGVQKGHLIWNIFIWLMFYSWPLPLPCRLHPDWGLGSSTWRWVGSVRWTLSYLNWRLPSYPLKTRWGINYAYILHTWG
jgi:hypothetical protein